MSSNSHIGLILGAVVAVSAGAVALAIGSREPVAVERAPESFSASCGPGQQALVERIGTGATARIHVQCLEAHGPAAASYVATTAGPQLLPVAAVPASAAVVQPVLYAQAPAAAPAPRAVRRAEPGPSVQKRLLIIGGASGAGAGIGALIGGKKGALIGAAIGGGGATVVDQVRHR